MYSDDIKWPGESLEKVREPVEGVGHTELSFVGMV